MSLQIRRALRRARSAGTQHHERENLFAADLVRHRADRRCEHVGMRLQRAFDLNGRNQTIGDLSGTGGTVALGAGTLTVGGPIPRPSPARSTDRAPSPTTAAGR